MCYIESEQTKKGSFFIIYTLFFLTRLALRVFQMHIFCFCFVCVSCGSSLKAPVVGFTVSLKPPFWIPIILKQEPSCVCVSVRVRVRGSTYTPPVGFTFRQYCVCVCFGCLI